MNFSAFTLEAAADLSAKQYHIVRLSAANLCNQASLATDSDTIGVLQNKPQSGEFATVAFAGLSKVVAGAAITAGDVFSSNGSGRAITVVSGDLGMSVGRAITAPGADGDVFDAQIWPPVRWVGAP